MSEKIPLNNERLSSSERLHQAEFKQHEERINKDLEAKAEGAANKIPSTQELSLSAKEKAISGAEVSRGEKADNRHHPVLINKQLKEMAYSRAMTRVRKRLSAPSRVLSKTMHSKLLERPSELASTTIARPSSMLGGAVVAAIGTSLLLWTTKHYGYEYNYLAAILLFVIGMILGLAVEGLLRITKKRS